VSVTPLVIAALAILAITIAGRMLRTRDNAALLAARDSAHVARLALEQAESHAARADSVAASAVAAARLAHEREQRATSHADSATRTLTVVRERYRVASLAVPDTCRTIVAAADTVLATADSVVSALRSALSASDERAVFLQLSLDTTRAALLQLRVAAHRSVAATAQLERRIAPSFLMRLARLAPRLGVGAAGGIDRYGRANVTTGITLGWSF